MLSNKVKVVLGSLIGAVAIHGAFVACTFGSRNPSGPGGTSGSPMSGKDGGIMGAIDAMVDAIAAIVDSSTSEAEASVDAGAGGQTIVGTLSVANEDCTGMFTAASPPLASGTAITFTYASHAYPGMTAAQLSQVRILGHLSAQFEAADDYAVPPGYQWDNGGIATITSGGVVFVTDGSVAVICSQSSSSTPEINAPPWYDSVTFTIVQ
jgi:hypothetical protein